VLEVIRVEVWPCGQAHVGGVTDGVDVPTVLIRVRESTQAGADCCQTAVQLHRHTAQ